MLFRNSGYDSLDGGREDATESGTLSGERDQNMTPTSLLTRTETMERDKSLPKFRNGTVPHEEMEEDNSDI